MRKFSKIITAIIFTIALFILQGCMTIETNMDINSNFTGVSVSKLSIAKGILPEEQLKKEIEKLGIKKFEMVKEESGDSTLDKYSLKMEWKSEEELKKILAFINTGAEMSEFGKSLNPSLTRNNAVNNNEGKTGTTEETVKIETKGKTGENKAETPKNLQGKIFVKEGNTVTVDMGIIKINKLVIKVKGKIVESSTQSGIVSDSKNEITFYEGDRVSFKYKDENFLLPILTGLSISILIIAGFFIFKHMKRKKEINPEEMEEFYDDTAVVENEEEKSEIEENVNIEGNTGNSEIQNEKIEDLAEFQAETPDSDEKKEIDNTSL